MALTAAGTANLVDVLDRVLDKGVVVDAWVRISIVGIDLVTLEARIIVASIETYLKYADILGLPTALTPSASIPEGAAETYKPRAAS